MTPGVGNGSAGRTSSCCLLLLAYLRFGFAFSTALILEIGTVGFDSCPDWDSLSLIAV